MCLLKYFKNILTFVYDKNKINKYGEIAQLVRAKES